MCGIAGFIDFDTRSDASILESMIASMHHRGPDHQDTDLYRDDAAWVGFAHARLSIIDLSYAAGQPMHYKYFSIVFNGEIYNYREIREELLQLGHEFSTSSDTEVILHSIEEWGIKAVDRFIGMFAFVILDKRGKKVFFVRDRAGVKPLFIYKKNNLLLFASELKAFHQHPSFTKEIAPESLQLFFTHGYIVGEKSIYKYCRKVLPAHYLILDLQSKETQEVQYWNPLENFYLPKFSESSYTDVKHELKDLLLNACQYRMVADVPVGIFLSGGYDSTAVAALLQTNSGQRLKTFTIGFEHGNNEAPDAKRIAEFLGTDHHESYCTEAEAQNIIQDLPHYYDEPFGDSSAIPTIMVSREAKKEVTVALSADGGDEIFGGYNSYAKFERYLRQLKKLPNSIHPVVKNFLALASGFTPDSNHALKHKFYGLNHYFSAENTHPDFCLFLDMAKTPEILLRNSLKQYRVQGFHAMAHNDINVMDAIMYHDYTQYMPDDILAKVDRATMSVSLEGREPLLDHRIWEMAARMPSSFKRNKSGGKMILKDIVHDMLPKELMDRPKKGFTVPVYHWLRNELSWYLDEYLNETSLKQSGLLNAAYCTDQVKKFKTGNFHYLPYIWYLLMFQMWYKKWMS